MQQLSRVSLPKQLRCAVPPLGRDPQACTEQALSAVQATLAGSCSDCMHIFKKLCCTSGVAMATVLHGSRVSMVQFFFGAKFRAKKSTACFEFKLQRLHQPEHVSECMPVSLHHTMACAHTDSLVRFIDL